MHETGSVCDKALKKIEQKIAVGAESKYHLIKVIPWISLEIFVRFERRYCNVGITLSVRKNSTETVLKIHNEITKIFRSYYT